MSSPDIVTYRVGAETNPTAMLLALAEAHGIQEQVAKALADTSGKVAHRGEELGPMLRRHRDVYGILIKEVHARSNISRSQLSFYESGMAKNPGLRTLQALAYGYRLPFIRLLMASLNEINPRMSVRNRDRD